MYLNTKLSLFLNFLKLLGNLLNSSICEIISFNLLCLITIARSFSTYFFLNRFVVTCSLPKLVLVLHTILAWFTFKWISNMVLELELIDPFSVLHTYVYNIQYMMLLYKGIREFSFYWTLKHSNNNGIRNTNFYYAIMSDFIRK